MPFLIWALLNSLSFTSSLALDATEITNIWNASNMPCFSISPAFCTLFPLTGMPISPFISLAKSCSSLKILYRHHLPLEAFPAHPSLSLECILLSYLSCCIHVGCHVRHSVLQWFIYAAEFSEDKPSSSSLPNLWFLSQSLENSKHLELCCWESF